MPYAVSGHRYRLSLVGEPRITSAVLSIFTALAEDPGEPRYGLDIAKQANLRHTTIYDTLARLEAAGWLRSEWEKIDPSADGRPRRRLYRLTGLGEDVAHNALERQKEALARVRIHPRWRPQPGGTA
jgi:PadR family transcriptional regulator, regulatory protein PadR